jgi:hypothetical protein
MHRLGFPAVGTGTAEAGVRLAALEGEQRRKAEEYVRKVPPGIAILYRQLIEEKLGWTPA